MLNIKETDMRSTWFRPEWMGLAILLALIAAAVALPGPLFPPATAEEGGAPRVVTGSPVERPTPGRKESVRPQGQVRPPEVAVVPPPAVAPWTRPYKGPGDSVLEVPIVIPIPDLKGELAKSLPNTLAEGKERLKLSKTVDTVQKFVEEKLELRKVPLPILRPKVKWVGFPPHPLIVPEWVDEMVDRMVPIKKEIERKVQAKIDYEVDFAYRVTPRKDTLSITMRGNQVSARLEVGYTIETSVVRAGPVPIAPPGRADGTIHLTLVRSLVWGDDGKLVPKDGNATARWDLRSGFTAVPPIDPGTIIKTNVLLDLLKGTLNAEIQKRLSDPFIDLQKVTEPLRDAQKLPGGICLLLHPSEIAPWHLTSDGKVVNSGVTIRCRPRIIVLGRGEAEPAATPQPKPMPAVTRPADPRCHIELEGVLAEELVGAKLAGLLGVDSGRLPKGVKIGTPRLRAAGGAANSLVDKGARGRVLVEIPVTRPFSTTVMISGTLFLADNVLWLEEVRCHTDPAVEMLAELVDPKLRKDLERGKKEIETTLNKVRWNLGDELTRLCPKPPARPEGKDPISVEGKAVKVTEVYVSPTDVKVIVVVDGVARVFLGSKTGTTAPVAPAGQAN
jgi:hypothetical protein